MPCLLWKPGKVTAMDYNLLHQKFQNRKQYLIFNKEVVVDRLKKRYKAEEISKEEIMDLINDDQLVYEHIFCCLKVENPKIIDKIFTEEELKEFQWEINDNKKQTRKYKFKTEAEANYNQLLIDEMEGRRVDIVLESLDGEYVTSFLVRSQSEEITSYIYAHMGGAKFTVPQIKELTQNARDITDQDFKDSYPRYLKCLAKYNLI